MKEKMPYCPICQTSKFVILEKRGTQWSTAIGGLAGVGNAYTCIAKPISIPRVIFALLSGFLTGATTGSAVGEQIDQKLRIQFRCNKCGKRIRG